MANVGQIAGTTRRRITFWMLQCPGWLLVAYLVFAQGVAAWDYELGVRMGTQEPASIITDVGTAFWYGFALGDIVTYIPILVLGLVGHWRGAYWGRMFFAAALGITIYWPVVCLITIVDARGARGWALSDEAPYWAVLPMIAIWGAWGLLTLARRSGNQDG